LGPSALFDFFTHRSSDFACKIGLLSSDEVTVHSLSLYFYIFFMTCALEAPFYISYLMFRKLGLLRSTQILILCNLATHPLVTFGFPWLAQSFNWNTAQSSLAKEIFAPLVESLLIRRLGKLGWTESFALGVAANLFSWWVGTKL
jgi:hypothetical protein